jgi:hypothetical protein
MADEHYYIHEFSSSKDSIKRCIIALEKKESEATNFHLNQPSTAAGASADVAETL